MDTINSVLSIISLIFGFTDSIPAISEEIIPYIESFSRTQSIVPIITAGIKKTSFNDLLTDSFSISEARAIYDYSQKVAALNEIYKALEKEFIPYIPLKGAVLRELYPEPWMRTSSDIDILVHKNELEKAIEALEKNTDFKCYLRAHHDVQFVNSHVHLELHFSLSTRLERLDKVLDRAWEYSVRVNNSNKYLFAPEFNMFYITAHAAKHLIREGGIGIRPILDMLVLRTKTKYDFDSVKKLCNEAGILGFYETCNQLIDVWFYGKKHTETTLSLEELVFSGGVFGSSHTRIVSNKRKDSGKKYIRSRIFKSSNDLKMYYPKCAKYPILVPFYQFARWGHIMKSTNTKKHLTEFKEAKTVDQSEVDNYDKLLKAMGL